MDPFTQRLLDRTRQRREVLQKKLENSPAQHAQRKRKPLSEDHSENLNNTEDTSNKKNEDSPKRQCLRESELEIKPDTPAIQGVRSRMHDLAARQKAWSGSDESMESEVAPSKAPEPELSETCMTPRTRKARLAALAQNINDWEDDSSHVTPARNQEKVATNKWKSGKGLAPKPPSSPVKASPVKGMAPLPPTHAAKSPFKSPEKSKNGFPVDEKEVLPDKPPRTFEYSKKEVLEVEEKQDNGTVVTKLTVTLGSSQIEAKNFSVVPGCSSPKKSPVKSMINSIEAENTDTLLDTTKRNLQQKSTFNRESFKCPVKTAETASLDESILEPTKHSVTSRMSAWQTKIEETENDNRKSPRSPSKITTAKPSVWKPNSAVKVETKSQSEVKQAPVPVVQTSDKQKRNKRQSFEPTTQSVHMRMAAWETRTKQDESEGNVSPLKSGCGIKGATSSSNLPLSPSKVAPATKSIQEKLNGLQKSWDNRDQKLQEVKQQRREELDQLSNRWKDGILKDTDSNSDSKPLEQKTSEPPAPPPAPPISCVAKPADPVPNRQTSNKIPSTARQFKTEDARLRAKHEEENKEENMDISEPDQTDSCKPTADNNDPNFESKLKAMGFDVESVTDLGHVASIDLKGKPRPERAIPKSSITQPASTPTAEKWEVKRDVTVSWNGSKTVEEKKISAVTTDMTKTTKELKINESVTPAKSGSTSIYSLIKRQQTPSVQQKPLAANPSLPKTTPAFAKPTASAVKNSKPYDDSFGDSIVESDTDDPSLTFVTTLHEDASSGASSGNRNLHSSLSSTNSESNYSDSQTEDYTETTADDYTEGDTTADDHSLDYTEDYTEDDDYSDEDDYTDEEEGVDTLLDEALDDSVEEAPQPAPRRKSTSKSSLKRAGSPEKPVFREPLAAPRRNPSGGHYSAYSHPSSTSSGSDTNTDNDDKPTVYSVEFYRAQKNKRNRSPPKMTVVRHSQHYPRDETEEPLPYIPQEEIKQKIRELQELVNQEQSIIMQTSNALNQCCGTNSSFAGSMEQIECNRLLLVACKKREAYITEIDRLKNPEAARVEQGARGSLTISDIRLPLKSDFVSKLGTSQDTSVHYFICLIRNGPQIIFTQMISTHDANVRGSLEFTNLIKVGTIRQNFKLTIEVYGMSVTREPAGATPKSKKSKGLTITPRKLMKKTSHTPLQSPGGPMAVRTTNFVLIGAVPLTMNDVNKMHFSLSKVPYLCPLQGSIHLRLRCLIESQVQEHGFLTMFEDVSGFGAWHRRWCVLKNNHLSFWKYPDDERIKEPIGRIDLKSCISENIGLIARDICARPNTFELLTVRRQNKGESDTLITRCYNTMTTVRHMLSADTKEDRVVWCNSLNQALANVRSWHSDALRPIKQSQ